MKKKKQIGPNNELVIDFLYIDLSECGRCQSSDKKLDEAIRELREQIHRKNINSIKINKTKISSDKKAKEHNLIRSPTLRINGQDIEEIVNDEYNIKENYCPSCSNVAGTECYEITGEGENQCRVFKYKGKTYENIPKQMIKEAIKKELNIKKETPSTCCQSPKQVTKLSESKTKDNSCC
ncbi:hypothetical protein C9439_07465 [archaeon SCG-AAA382B04]|nr:hypothetical protein C9439_07465 [archaeon SCG-AAA382B04]